MNKEIWILWGKSESGDHYGKVVLDHEPNEQDKKNYILTETPEAVNINGPGDCGSYVYVKSQKSIIKA